MGLTVRLQSAPHWLPAALHSSFITISVNVRAFAHWKKRCEVYKVYWELWAKMHFPWLQCHLVVKIEDKDRLLIFLAGVTYIPSLVSFGVWSGSEKCNHLGQKKKIVIWKTIGTSQVETCSGPNNNENGEFLVGVTVWCFLCIWWWYICVPNLVHVCACRRRGLDC